MRMMAPALWAGAIIKNIERRQVASSCAGRRDDVPQMYHESTGIKLEQGRSGVGWLAALAYLYNLLSFVT